MPPKILIGSLCLALFSGNLAGQEPPDDPAAQAAKSTAEWPPHLDGPPNEERKDAFSLSPPIHGEALQHAAREAYQKGFDFLIRTQNSDGSWGSHDPKAAFLRDFGFSTTNRGSQDGVRLACTAIIAKALLRKPTRNEAEEAALQKAAAALLKTEKFAYHLGESFNTWGYGYKLDFLCDYLESEFGGKSDAGSELRAEVAAAAKVCIDGLLKFQQADGGWNYYAGPLNNADSMSFNTANFAEILLRAKRLELPVPEGMAEDAYKLVRRFVTLRGGAVYDARFLMSPNSVNELSAGSRTAAVAEALAESGQYGPADLMRAMHLFNEGENWLEDGRKLIQPHTAVHQISGYFFFYGYHYLSEFLHRLGEQVPPARWERSAWTMIRTQEEDGGWWDTAAAGYGDKWGSGFALLTLDRCFEAWNADAARRNEADENEARR